MRTLTAWTLLIAGCCAVAIPAAAADTGAGPNQLYWTCAVINAEGVPFRAIWVDARTQGEAVGKADAHARAYLDGRVLDCH